MVLGSEEAELRVRFQHEAKALALLGQSPNSHIVNIFNIDELDEAPYLVMEYVDGGSLEAASERGCVLGLSGR